MSREMIAAIAVGIAVFAGMAHGEINRKPHYNAGRPAVRRHVAFHHHFFHRHAAFNLHAAQR